jgi:hypothetical protein
MANSDRMGRVSIDTGLEDRTATLILSASSPKQTKMSVVLCHTAEDTIIHM